MREHPVHGLSACKGGQNVGFGGALGVALWV